MMKTKNVSRAESAGEENEEKSKCDRGQQHQLHVDQ